MVDPEKFYYNLELKVVDMCHNTACQKWLGQFTIYQQFGYIFLYPYWVKQCSTCKRYKCCKTLSGNCQIRQATKCWCWSSHAHPLYGANTNRLRINTQLLRWGGFNTQFDKTGTIGREQHYTAQKPNFHWVLPDGAPVCFYWCKGLCHTYRHNCLGIQKDRDNDTWDYKNIHKPDRPTTKHNQ